MGSVATALAPSRARPYLKDMAQPIHAQIKHDMVSDVAPQGRAAKIIVGTAAGLGVIVVLGAVALWIHYGTAVFFEMIATGIAACF